MGVRFGTMQGQTSWVKEFHLSPEVFDNACRFFRQQATVGSFA
jgi:hypothetical protein